MLNKSEYEAGKNTINFIFKAAESGFLKSMDYDRKIQKIIKNLIGMDYKINFVDKVCSEGDL